MDSEYAIAEFVAICRTEECENQGTPINVLADPAAPNVTCGPCANTITDLTLVSE